VCFGFLADWSREKGVVCACATDDDDDDDDLDVWASHVRALSRAAFISTPRCDWCETFIDRNSVSSHELLDAN
jgi:hypothetical protein